MPQAPAGFTGGGQDDQRPALGALIFVHTRDATSRREHGVGPVDAGGAQDPPMSRRDGLLGIEVEARQVRDRKFDRQRPRAASGATASCHVERPHGRTPKGREMRAAAERRAHVGGQHAHAYVPPPHRTRNEASWSR